MEKTEFKKGEYIVQLHETKSEELSQNYIYKQFKDAVSLYTDKDNEGGLIISSYVSFDKKETWRYATKEEIEHYDKIGKPYDVKTLKVANSNRKYPNGPIDIKGRNKNHVVSGFSEHISGVKHGNTYLADNPDIRIIGYQDPYYVVRWTDVNDTEVVQGFLEENLIPVSPLQDANLTGRYLKALVNNPECARYKKGEYVKILRKCEGDEHYAVELDKSGYRANVSKKDIWELMPIGFEPDKSTDKIDLTGRYLKALVKYPEGTGYKTGEYAKIIEYRSLTSVTLDRCGCLADTQHEDWQLMTEGFDPTPPKHLSFYVRYSKGFTESLYIALEEWAKNNSLGKPRDYNDSYEGLMRSGYYLFDNYGFHKSNYYPEDINGFHSYGVDNNIQGCKTEYLVEEVKKLIGYVEDTPPIDPSIPQYLEAIKHYNDYIIKGIIYRVIEYKGQHSVDVECNLKSGRYTAGCRLCAASYVFKPSTKSNYESQKAILDPTSTITTGSTSYSYVLNTIKIGSDTECFEDPKSLKTTVEKLNHQEPVLLSKTKSKKSILVLTV